MSQPKRIVVTIDKLILKGISSTNANVLTKALQKSLYQELTNRGIALSSKSQTNISLANVTPQKLTPSHSSFSLGLNAGRAIYRSIRSGIATTHNKNHQSSRKN